MLARAWRALPWDGLGSGPADDPVLDRLRRRAASAFWQRFDPRLRLPLRLAARCAWPLAALARTWRFKGHDLSLLERLALWRDSVRTGADPMEAWAWRALFGGSHPLPGRSLTLVLLGTGSPAGHRLLTDKLATERLLAATGVPVVRTMRLLRRGDQPDPDVLPVLPANGLFVKPRTGSAGRGAFAVVPDGAPIDEAELLHRLARAAEHEDVLVQERLREHADLADLACDGRAPVLRLTTARRPGERPYTRSALLTVAVPGVNPRRFLRGTVRVPVELASGRLKAGVWLADPRTSLARLPWNGAVLAGRTIPDFDRAVDAVLSAAAVIPPMALISWDLIPTADGPVVMEGNGCGDWILSELADRAESGKESLAELLHAWSGAPVQAGQV